MTAGDFLFQNSTSNWYSQHVDYQRNMCAFLSGPHQANPHGLFLRRSLNVAPASSNTAENSPRSRPDKRNGFCGSGTDLPLFPDLACHCGSSMLSKSWLSQRVSKPRRRRCWTVRSSVLDSVQLEALSPRGIGPVNLLIFLSGFFTDFPTSSLIASFTISAAALGLVGAYVAQGITNSENSSTRLVELKQPGIVGNWLNLSKPSAFNRFVAARCPSLSSSVHTGYLKNLRANLKVRFEQPEYQRLCLHAHDGGTVAMDWPSHLDLERSREFENVLLLISGTTEGSEETGIGEFSRFAEQRGYFPMILNPRGCGGSPVTTPRVFSAADSDDVRLAVHFIAKSRPWATIMGVGWGFGANMLTKYLGEEGYATPLTAAVCIDNPFTLNQQCLRVSRWGDLFERLTKGLVQILSSNKKLFQGDRRGFDISGALAATSLHEFEKAISTVAHGYDNVEDFYQSVSSGASLENVQIPLMCVQHKGDYLAPHISTPREAFERNPYTMLVVSPSDVNLVEASTLGLNYPGAAAEWSHSITLEWLAAVEVALLKGRHPLLDDVDVTVKPSKEWSGIEKKFPPISADSYPGLASSNVVGIPDANDDVEGEIVDVDGKTTKSHVHSEAHAEGGHEHNHEGNTKSRGNDAAGKAEEQQGDPEEVERGQAQLAADSVIKVLDVTMPGTLSDEQKQQVVDSVARGETLVSAMQEAVPEDVRGKMVDAVSAAVQAQGFSLKMAGFGDHLPAPKLPEGVAESLRDKLAGLAGKSEVSTTSNQDGASKTSLDVKKDGSGAPNEPPTNNSSGDTQESKSNVDGEQKTGDSSKVEGKGDKNEGTNLQNGQPTRNEDKDKESLPDSSGGTGRVKDSSDKEADGGETIHKPKDEIDDKKESKVQSGSGGITDKAASGKSSDTSGQGDEHQQNHEVQDSNQEKSKEADKDNAKSKSDVDPVRGEGQTPNSGESKVDKNQETQASAPKIQDSNPVEVSPPPPIMPSVGQALQAITGFDDSTQMAVTNVFGVVENMLDQLEKEKSSRESGNSVTEAKGQNEGSDEHVPVGSNGKSDPGKPSNAEQSAKSNHDSEGEHENDTGRKDQKRSEAKRNVNLASVSHEGVQLQRVGQQSHGPSKDNSEIREKQGDEKRDAHLERQSSAQASPKVQERKLLLPPQEEVDRARPGNGLRAESVNGSVELDFSMSKQSFLESSNSELLGMSSEQNGTRKDKPKHHDLRSPPHTTVELPHSSSSTDNASNTRLDETAAEIVEEDKCSTGHSSKPDRANHTDGSDSDSENDHGSMVRELVMNALKLEIVRRLGVAGLEAVGADLEEEVRKVAHAVSEAVRNGKDTILGSGDEEVTNIQREIGGKLGVLNGNSIVKSLGSVISSSNILGGVVPVGVLVGVVLAALGAIFLIVTDDCDEEKSSESTLQNYSPQSVFSSEQHDELRKTKSADDSSNGSLDHHCQPSSVAKQRVDKNPTEAEDKLQEATDDGGAEAKVFKSDSEGVGDGTSSLAEGSNGGHLMDAMAAAMGATAAVASQTLDGTAVDNQGEQLPEAAGDELQNVDNSGDNNKLHLVPEIAEKAISLVAPVVPKRGDGKVDQDRLVAMLAEVGQKGGLLTLVGKFALLWGGLRGAMSLSDRLLGFFHMKERPLQERILGFLGMAFLLWTPVLVPLLPSLLQQWATKSQGGVADAAAGIGLYGALFILITIWGKRVRGYNRPLVRYGLQLLSRAKVQVLASGMAIGVSLVSTYYAINWALGYVRFSGAALVMVNPSHPGKVTTTILTSWRLTKLIGQSLCMGLAVALVEELLFRAWLQEEIAAEFGYHWAVVLSALAFALVHWSPPAIAGLWFLSVALAGARARMQGDLSIPIGIHSGIVAAFTVVNTGGLAHYVSSAPNWFTGAYVGNPLAGALGTAMVAAFAIGLYPRQHPSPQNDDDGADDDDGNSESKS